jgi:S-adenosylmethionine synthetase
MLSQPACHADHVATAGCGRFGREQAEFTWEATDKALALKQAA